MKNGVSFLNGKIVGQSWEKYGKYPRPYKLMICREKSYMTWRMTQETMFDYRKVNMGRHQSFTMAVNTWNNSIWNHLDKHIFSGQIYNYIYIWINTLVNLKRTCIFRIFTGPLPDEFLLHMRRPFQEMSILPSCVSVEPWIFQ